MVDRPGITFSVYTSREIHTDLESIARQERRSVSSMVAVLLEQAMEDWHRLHIATGPEASPCSPTS